MNTLYKPRVLLSIMGISALAFIAISAAALPASAGGTVASLVATPADNIARPVAPTVPSNADPNDGFTVEAVNVSTGQVLEPGQAVRIHELQATPSRECTPADSAGISICAGIGVPDRRAQPVPFGPPSPPTGTVVRIEQESAESR